MNDALFYVGQALGLVAIVLGILSYQVKTQKKLLLLQSFTAFVFIVHYLFINAISGMALNVICFIKNVYYYYKHDRGGAGKVSPIVLSSLTLILGIITAIQASTWYSVFLIIGLTVHVYCFSLPNPQHVRGSILFTSPMVLIYNVFALSIGGIVYESVAVASSFIGIIRYRKLNRIERILPSNKSFLNGSTTSNFSLKEENDDEND